MHSNGFCVGLGYGELIFVVVEVFVEVLVDHALHEMMEVRYSLGIHSEWKMKPDREEIVRHTMRSSHEMEIALPSADHLAVHSFLLHSSLLTPNPWKL